MEKVWGAHSVGFPSSRFPPRGLSCPRLFPSRRAESVSVRLTAPHNRRKHGGHQEENADAEAGQGERHRPGRAGRGGQKRSRGQMQTGDDPAILFLTQALA